MEIELHLPPSEIKSVFVQVGSASAKAPWAGQANAPDLSVITEWRDRLWSTIENAIVDVADKTAEMVERGRERAKEWLQQVQDMIGDMRKQIGARAEEVLTRVQDLLFEACQRLQNAMLKLLPAI